MEVTEAQDMFTVGPDGKPSKVTDYLLAFPQDFRRVKNPELAFTTSGYVQTSFRIEGGSLASDIAELRKRRKAQRDLEHGIVLVNDGSETYRVKSILTGETGIGFQVSKGVTVSDYLHTHSIHEEEEDRTVDLFSAFDLWSMGSKGAERYWLVGRDVTWVLVNIYGQQYYHYVRDACWDLAIKESTTTSYERLLTDLLNCADRCNYRLYRSEDSINYTLVSLP